MARYHTLEERYRALSMGRPDPFGRVSCKPDNEPNRSYKKRAFAEESTAGQTSKRFRYDNNENSADRSTRRNAEVASAYRDPVFQNTCPQYGCDRVKLPTETIPESISYSDQQSAMGPQIYTRSPSVFWQKMRTVSKASSASDNLKADNARISKISNVTPARVPDMSISDDSNIRSAAAITVPESKPLEPVVTPELRPDPTCAERKQLVLYNPPANVRRSMARFVGRVLSAIPKDLDSKDCWLHPNPPSSQRTISWSTSFRYDCYTHVIGLHFGTVKLYLEGRLTNEQKEGIIRHSWHLSHLCGNWICCNWEHFTVEPGSVNQARKRCFSGKRLCSHKPPCLVEMKIASDQLLLQTVRS